MAGINQTATLEVANGLAKKVEGKIRDMVPKKNLRMINRIKYDGENVLGGEYEELVWLTGEHGFTYGGNSTRKRTLNASEVAESQPAKLKPNTIHFRSEATIDMMSRAKDRGEKSYESYISAVMRNSRKAFDKRLEVAVCRGGSPIAKLASATDAGTTSVMTINPKWWIPHIWLNSRNCPLDAFNGTTHLNTAAPLYVRSVDMKNKTVTVSGASADIDAIVAAGTDCDIYYLGARSNDGAGTALDGTGMRTIANLTSGTTYLDISTTNYSDVWNGTQITWDSDTTDFSWMVLNDGLEEAAGRGLDGDVIVQVPFPAWNQLNNSLDALRVLDSSYSVNKAEMGHTIDSIVYNSLTGKCTVEASGFQAYGEVLVYPDPGDEADHTATPRRIGSSPVVFEYPGKGGEMFNRVDGTNAVEWYAFTDQAVWMPNPRGCVHFGS